MSGIFQQTCAEKCKSLEHTIINNIRDISLKQLIILKILIDGPLRIFDWGNGRLIWYGHPAQS